MVSQSQFCFGKCITVGDDATKPFIDLLLKKKEKIIVKTAFDKSTEL